MLKLLLVSHRSGIFWHSSSFLCLGTLFLHTVKHWPTGKRVGLKWCCVIVVSEQWSKIPDPFGNQQYTGCAISGEQPNTWLTSNLIKIPSKVKKVDVTFQYNIRNCTVLNGDNFCREYFDFYMHQSMTSTKPNPLQNNATYEKIAEITSLILGFNVREVKTFGIGVKGNNIILAFHNQGCCSGIYSVTVSYYVCPEFTAIGRLVSLPKSMAPANNSEPVQGSCVTNAVYNEGNVSVYCQSDGFWNISSLKGRCICKEDLENREGECKGTSYHKSD